MSNHSRGDAYAACPSDATIPDADGEIPAGASNVTGVGDSMRTALGNKGTREPYSPGIISIHACMQ